MDRDVRADEHNLKTTKIAMITEIAAVSAVHAF